MTAPSPSRTVTADLAALAERAISQQVHPANWSHWVRLVMMAGPARDFIEAASPSAVLAILAALPVSPTDGLDAFDWDQAEPALIEAFTEVIADNPPDNALMVTTEWAFEVLTALSDRGYVLARREVTRESE